MQNLYFSTQYQPTSDDFPDQEKQKLLGYQNTIQGIRDQITPDKDLQGIDETILQVFLRDIRSVSSGVNQTRNSNISLIVDGVNRIYKLLTKAINQLNVALLILTEIEKVGLTRKLGTDYFECLNECEGHLAEILQEFKDMQL
jgi:hypothetical protein